MEIKDYLLLGLFLVLAILSILYNHRKKKNHKKNCTGNCSCCSYACDKNCSPYVSKVDEDKKI